MTDPVVVTMLRKLPVPDHGDAFWDELEVELRGGAEARPPLVAARVEVAAAPAGADPGGEDTVTAPRTPATPPPSAPILPGAVRRGSNVALLVVAAAIVAVVAMAGFSLLRDDSREAATSGSGTTTPASQVTLPQYTGTTAAPAQPGGDPSPAPALEAVSGEPPSAEAAATSFVVAVVDGSPERAWELLAEPSRAHWGDPGALAAGASELVATGYGAFREAVTLDLATIVLDTAPDGSEVGVVVVDGVVQLEGRRARRTLELPYRYEPGFGTYRVDPWSPGVGAASPIRFTAPIPADEGQVPYGTILRTDDPSIPVEALIPEWATSGVLAVDGEPVERFEPPPDDGTGADPVPRTLRFEPPEPFAPGVHRVTVAAAAENRVTAVTLLLRTP